MFSHTDEVDYLPNVIKSLDFRSNQNYEIERSQLARISNISDIEIRPAEEAIDSGQNQNFNDVGYSYYQTIQSAIERETKEIENTHPTYHSELAQLYVSRGESYLIDTQYENAIEDFQKAEYHLQSSPLNDQSMIVAFRKAMGEAVGYDNLGMALETKQAIQQLQTISIILAAVIA